MHRVHNEDLNVAEKRKIWSELIVEYENLNLTQRQFCLEREIKFDLFCYYYRRHKKKTEKSHSLPTQFIPLISAEEKPKSALRLACHPFELHVPLAFEEGHLLRVLKVLSQVPC